jgi:hypothetical protein
VTGVPNLDELTAGELSEFVSSTDRSVDQSVRLDLARSMFPEADFESDDQWLLALHTLHSYAVCRLTVLRMRSNRQPYDLFENRLAVIYQDIPVWARW